MAETSMILVQDTENCDKGTLRHINLAEGGRLIPGPYRSLYEL